MTVYPVGESLSAVTVAPSTIAGSAARAAGADTMAPTPSDMNASNEIVRLSLRLTIAFVI
ncbi:hypothetical protein [Micromonospora globbae]|uniref:hypothetical protein n=1 Tax=Micromonospora globbae TaxID=1894969 RepID=UPI00341DCF78|nr:hypothetical protein OH732_14560 [Micromonospora globbae]